MVFVQIWPFCQPFFFHLIQVTKMSFTIFQKVKKAFQAIKTRSLKSRKGYPMVLGQIWPFFQPFFFQAIQVTEMFFTIFQIEKTPIQAVKTRSTTSRKIDIFPKGLTQGFGPNVAIFPTFFFRQYRLGKCLLRYCRTKKRLSRL